MSNTQYILRKCIHCGKEANSEKDLDLFERSPESLYGRANICWECYNKKYNIPRNPINNKNLTSFRGRLQWNQVNPRTNACSECGKKYPDELKRQTHFHHDTYDPEHPLANTRELCASCHQRWHNLHTKIYKHKEGAENEAT